jgi:phosphatidylserine/phosphatidylglycerophosphate/cardiolipin synthase-like enzyme
MKKIYALSFLIFMLVANSAFAFHKDFYNKEDKEDVASSISLPSQGEIEVAFSPNEGSEALVIKVIDSANTKIDMLAYSFTNVPIARALMKAAKRGVKVTLVADYKENITEDKYGSARKALSAVQKSGAEVRVIDVYPVMHDKSIVADGETTQNGSFNYSDAAAHKNSENVFVNWQNKKLADVYEKHFLRNYRQSEEFKAQ